MATSTRTIGSPRERSDQGRPQQFARVGAVTLPLPMAVVTHAQGSSIHGIHLVESYVLMSSASPVASPATGTNTATQTELLREHAALQASGCRVGQRLMAAVSTPVGGLLR